MDLHLEEDTAVVVGGANGIGKAIAVGFADEGCSVTVLDLHPADPSLRDSLSERSRRRCDEMIVDATEYDQMQQMADRVANANHGAIHLVYAAGAGSGKYGFRFGTSSQPIGRGCWT